MINLLAFCPQFDVMLRNSTPPGRKTELISRLNVGDGKRAANQPAPPSQIGGMASPHADGRRENTELCSDKSCKIHMAN
jgi:hypothetical protein